MLDKLVDLHPENAGVVEYASHVLDWDLRSHFRAENAHAFARNVDVQVGVFLANHLFYQILIANKIFARRSLGLSLGEYNHLVHIGALKFEDALRLVRHRGHCYDAGPRGWMAAVQPMDAETLRAALVAVQDFGLVEVVNLNSPRQQVIAGERAAVEAAIALLEDEHFAQCHVIERDVPMHSSLFEEVGQQFARVLEKVNFARPSRPYIPNRCGTTLHDPHESDFRRLLAEHIYSPVLWQQSIDHVRETELDPVFVEVGPLGVLYNLLNAKWCKCRKYRLDSAEDSAAHLRAVIAQLGELCHAGAPPAELRCSLT
jgi:[acyl-carrier-protein] S-malonyltransferase